MPVHTKLWFWFQPEVAASQAEQITRSSKNTGSHAHVRDDKWGWCSQACHAGAPQECKGAGPMLSPTHQRLLHRYQPKQPLRACAAADWGHGMHLRLGSRPDLRGTAHSCAQRLRIHSRPLLRCRPGWHCTGHFGATSNLGRGAQDTTASRARRQHISFSKPYPSRRGRRAPRRPPCPARWCRGAAGHRTR